MTSLPAFDLPNVVENQSGWGPLSSGSTIDDFKTLPFQQFNKCDRIGRVVDWLGDNRYNKKSDARYNERMYGSSATAGNQFDYVHDNEDLNFQLVDTTRQQKPQRYRQRPVYKRISIREQERLDAKFPNKKNQRNMNQLRGGRFVRGRGTGRGRHMGGRRFNDRQANRNRPASVQIKSNWELLQDIDFPRLQKMSLPNIEGQDIPGRRYGELHYYDKTIDKVSVKNPTMLQRLDGVFYSITTTDDPVIQDLAKDNVANVFATDIILATLMTAPRSVNSWDIVAYRVGDKLFFDKRDSDGFTNPIDMITVSETAQEPPPFEGGSLNNAKELATEALFINQNFRRQVLKMGDPTFKYENPSVPFDDGEDSNAEIAYKYRKFNLGKLNDTPINLVVRTENDAVLNSPSGDVHKLTIKAFNEWDSTTSGGVDWRSKLENQKGAVLATELKNNNCKLAKWTLQALLAGSDYIKFGFVSRVNVRSSVQHEILSTQQYRPTECAQKFNLNVENCWGILRAIIDYFMEKPQGKYLIFKDPMQSTIRLFALPSDAFDSTDDDDSDLDDEGNDD